MIGADAASDAVLDQNFSGGNVMERYVDASGAEVLVTKAGAERWLSATRH